jgi:hypothetical protein
MHTSFAHSLRRNDPFAFVSFSGPALRQGIDSYAETLM